MGLTVKACDPFKSEADVGILSALDEVLSCDVVTLHTPIEKSGEHPTWHLIGEAELQRMKPDVCLINASRGAVIDNEALLEHLKTHDDFCAILDVWENEPELNTELLDWCALGTPHIAGYSLDGKMRGTELVYQGESYLLYARLPDGSEIAVRGAIREGTFGKLPQVGDAVKLGLHKADTVVIADGDR